MRPIDEALEELRGEIDKIDDALQDLLIRRAGLTQEIAKVKQPATGSPAGSLTPALRPAREARILRRLIARHTGGLPVRVIVRIWREIIGASLRSQSKFQLHVYGGANAPALRDLAVAHFGSLTPIRMHPKPSLVVHSSAEEPNSLGLLPVPEIEEQGSAWWAQLAPAGGKGAHVIAKLPFAVESEDEPSAYAIGAIEQEASGADTTVLLLETNSGLSRTRLQSLFKEAGLDAKLVAAGRLSDPGAADRMLVEVKGFVGNDDPRLLQVAQAAGEAVARLAPVGGFATPILLAADNR